MIPAAWRRLLAADPGLQRTYLAARVTLAVAMALALAYSPTRYFRQPVTVAMLAVSTAMVTSMAVAGRDQVGQARALALAWAVALGSVALGVTVAQHRLASFAVFVAVMAAGAWAARFGPAGFGAGMVAFMTYFFTLFLRASPDRLPWLLAAATAGVLSTAVVRFAVLPYDPRRRLRRLLVALREGASRLAELRPSVDPETDRGRRALRRAALAVDDVVLQVHDLLDDVPELVEDPQVFRRHLFAVVTLGHLLVLRAMDGGPVGGAAVDATLGAPVPDPAARLGQHLAALEASPEERAMLLLADGAAGPAVEREVGGDSPAPSGAVAATPAPGEQRRWPTGSTRTAIQVAVAGAVSIAAGVMLSPERWYWAAISAFVVFANTGSRAATLRKAVERLLGTLGGVAAGLVLGTLLAGRTGLELLAVFPLLFVAFWMLQASYAIMIGMITVLLALLYDMMGMLTVDVLLLRLGETLVGAGTGIAVAYFVLPTRTRAAADEALGSYLGALDELLATLTSAAARGVRAEAEVLEAVRAVDRSLAGLRTVVRPAVASVPGRRSHTLRQEVILALTARYWVHRVAARLLFHPGLPDPRELERGAAPLRARIARMRSGSGGGEGCAEEAAGTAPVAVPLLRMDAVLAELARTRAARP